MVESDSRIRSQSLAWQSAVDLSACLASVSAREFFVIALQVPEGQNTNGKILLQAPAPLAMHHQGSPLPLPRGSASGTLNGSALMTDVRDTWLLLLIDLYTLSFCSPRLLILCTHVRASVRRTSDGGRGKQLRTPSGPSVSPCRGLVVDRSGDPRRSAQGLPARRTPSCLYVPAPFPPPPGVYQWQMLFTRDGFARAEWGA